MWRVIFKIRVIFGVRFERRKVDKKANLHENWSMQTLFWSILNILPNVIKIDPCNFELHCFKVGAFFETQCRCQAILYCRLIVLEILQSRDYFEVLVLVLLSVLILVCILLFNRLVKLKLGRHFPMKINWIICWSNLQSQYRALHYSASRGKNLHKIHMRSSYLVLIH